MYAEDARKMVRQRATDEERKQKAREQKRESREQREAILHAQTLHRQSNGSN